MTRSVQERAPGNCPQAARWRSGASGRAEGARHVAAALASAAAALALCGGCVWRAPEPPPAIFRLPAQPGSDATAASPAETWRYVPASPGETARPDPADFARVHSHCQRAPNPPGTTAVHRDDRDGEHETGAGGHAEAVARCMAERGFYRPQCSNGRDDDGDGASDFPADSGCAGPDALLEAPECSNGRDDDGDGLADWNGGGFTHPDPDCKGRPDGASERPPRRFRNPFSDASP